MRVLSCFGYSVRRQLGFSGQQGLALASKQRVKVPTSRRVPSRPARGARIVGVVAAGSIVYAY